MNATRTAFVYPGDWLDPLYDAKGSKFSEGGDKPLARLLEAGVFGRVFAVNCGAHTAANKYMTSGMHRMARTRALGAYALSGRDRHVYELVTGDLPVKAYFDVEREGRPVSDAEAVLVRECIEAVLLRETGAARIETLVLSASDADKFSQHLVCELTTAEGEAVMFASPGDLKRWILPAVTRALPEELRGMVDPAVYGNNQAFRMFLSSKAKVPERVLRVPGEGVLADLEHLEAAREWVASQGRSSERVPWVFRTLVQYQPPGTRAIVLSSAPEASSRSRSRASAASPGVAGAADDPLLAWARGKMDPLAESVYYLDPAVDPRAPPLSTHAIIRSRNRECAISGRTHRSNHIRWHVDLNERVAWQGCMDPDCAEAYRRELRYAKSFWPMDHASIKMIFYRLDQ